MMHLVARHVRGFVMQGVPFLAQSSHDTNSTDSSMVVRECPANHHDRYYSDYLGGGGFRSRPAKNDNRDYTHTI